MRNVHRQNHPHYPALDGLRGLAILLVVFYHNFGFVNYFLFGWLGVDLFFVLSGFLITSILLRSRSGPNYFQNFYMRRLLRIAPLYYLSLTIFLYVLPLLTDKIDFSYYFDHQQWFWIYLQNWLLIRPESTNNTTAMHHFWSLAVEEQYYILWPWLVIAIKKPKRLLAVVLTLLVSIIIGRTYLWTNHLESFNYFGFYTFTRIDGLCIGSSLAILQFINSKLLNQNSSLIIFILAGLNFLFYFINIDKEFPYMATVGYSTFAVIFAFITHEATQVESFLSRILKWRPLVFFGTISYSLYIIHWPFYLLIQSWLKEKIQEIFSPSPSILPVIVALTVTILAIGLSFFIYHLYEKQFLKLKRAFS